jgi:hypothetical protein
MVRSALFLHLSSSNAVPDVGPLCHRAAMLPGCRSLRRRLDLGVTPPHPHHPPGEVTLPVQILAGHHGKKHGLKPCRYRTCPGPQTAPANRLGSVQPVTVCESPIPPWHGRVRIEGTGDSGMISGSSSGERGLPRRESRKGPPCHAWNSSPGCCGSSRSFAATGRTRKRQLPVNRPAAAAAALSAPLRTM